MTASREQALGEANRVWGTELAIYVEPPDADPHARSCGRAPEQSGPLSRSIVRQFAVVVRLRIVDTEPKIVSDFVGSHQRFHYCVL